MSFWGCIIHRADCSGAHQVFVRWKNIDYKVKSSLRVIPYGSWDRRERNTLARDFDAAQAGMRLLSAQCAAW